MGKKIPLIVVLGPTASGKTALAVELALRLKGEIVSADSMQVYKGMDIGTAKPSMAERRGVPHHMLDVVKPTALYSLADYCADAAKCIADIAGRGNLPILAGGTGLYIDSLLQGTRFDGGERDPAYRKSLSELAEREGGEALSRLLENIDPQAAESLHKNDIGRLIRALEINRATGLTVAEYKRLSQKEESAYEPCRIGLTYENRRTLYDAIDARVDEMLQKGWLSEAERLQREGLTGESTALQAIGYKELMAHLKGEISLEEAAGMIKQATRRYAKRQLTWFRRDQSIFWIERDVVKSPLDEALKKIAECGGL